MLKTLKTFLPPILSVGRAGADALWECVCENMKDYWRTGKVKLTWTIVLKKVFSAMAGRAGELLAPLVVQAIGEKPFQRLQALGEKPLQQFLACFESIKFSRVDPHIIRNTGTAMQPGILHTSASRIRCLQLATRCNIIPPASNKTS
ncbi:hypothetical protein F4821DRAFT_275660 [Hypoxylon rubiginosum]|uniref:Uncharacterized protein n=1 Tax=Hypoxylon rubiginosum TaxID=110542 RepID=A0ACC0CK71_9PEZI|nr:hypothetical protein F4821DRAFT_275660 [Hypoxylon rubiginosum]